MSDVLGARIGSDDPEEIARVRASVPQILAIGAQPTATRKQMPRSGAVYDDRGYLEGRDPRTMSPDELVAMGHAPMSPLRAIRTHCLDCCAGSSQEVANCMALLCRKRPLRIGAIRAGNPPSDEQRQAMQERGRQLAKANRSRLSDAQDHGAGPSPCQKESLKIGRLLSPQVSNTGGSDVVRDIGSVCVPESSTPGVLSALFFGERSARIPQLHGFALSELPLSDGEQSVPGTPFQRTATTMQERIAVSPQQTEVYAPTQKP